MAKMITPDRAFEGGPIWPSRLIFGETLEVAMIAGNIRSRLHTQLQHSRIGTGSGQAVKKKGTRRENTRKTALTWTLISGILISISTCYRLLACDF